MRTIEIILVILIGIRLAAGFKWHERRMDWWVIGTLGVLVIHLGFEGYRWQMLVLYVIVFVLAFFAILRIAIGKPPIKTSLLISLVSIAILIAATIIPILVPIPKTKEPSGPYGIGTMTVMLVDESREEIYSESSQLPRKLMVQIWYPTEPEIKGWIAPWIDNVDVMAPAIADLLELPYFSLDHLRYVYGHANLNAPLSDGMAQYPILLFSHGWSGFRAQNTFQVEELASHGYIIAAPDHTYGAVASVFPDGEVVHLNPEALPSKGSLPEDDRLEAVRQLGGQWAGDLSFILDSLMEPGTGDDLEMFSNRIDSDKVGAFGHSTGGGAAVQFCWSDPRCKVVLGMDPYLEPVSLEVLGEGLEAPVLAMFSESWGKSRKLLNQLRSNSNGEVIQLMIKETAHYDFFGLKGKIAGDRVVMLIMDYTLDFFGEKLLGVESDLLQGPSEDYPEVIWVD